MYKGMKIPKGVSVGKYKITKKCKNGINTYPVPETEEEVKELLISLRDDEREVDLNSWTDVKRKKDTRDAAILTFASEFISKMKLSHEQYKEMISIINIGLFVKWLDVEMENNKITRMKGLKYKDGKFSLNIRETDITINYKN